MIGKITCRCRAISSTICSLFHKKSARSATCQVWMLLDSSGAKDESKSQQSKTKLLRLDEIERFKASLCKLPETACIMASPISLNQIKFVNK